MKLEPNVGKAYRVFCIVVGVALCAIPFLLGHLQWNRGGVEPSMRYELDVSGSRRWLGERQHIAESSASPVTPHRPTRYRCQAFPREPGIFPLRRR